MTHKKDHNRPDLSGPQPFTYPPDVLFSAQARVDLEMIVRRRGGAPVSALEELLCSRVRAHGVGLESERMYYDRYRAMVSGMELVYDLLAGDRVMVVSVRAVGPYRRRSEVRNAQTQGDGRCRVAVPDADVGGGPGWSGGDLV